MSMIGKVDNLLQEILAAVKVYIVLTPSVARSYHSESVSRRTKAPGEAAFDQYCLWNDFVIEKGPLVPASPPRPPACRPLLCVLSDMLAVDVPERCKHHIRRTSSNPCFQNTAKEVVILTTHHRLIRRPMPSEEVEDEILALESIYEDNFSRTGDTQVRAIVRPEEDGEVPSKAEGM